jgi:hypothetical protein
MKKRNVQTKRIFDKLEIYNIECRFDMKNELFFENLALWQHSRSSNPSILNGFGKCIY